MLSGGCWSRLSSTGQFYQMPAESATSIAVGNESEGRLARLPVRDIWLRMKQIAIVLVSLAVTTGSLFAVDTKRTVVPGSDDLSRYVAAKPTPGGQTTLRDASGRTLGTAS